MRYEVTAHIYEDYANEKLLKALRLEVDAESEFLAHDNALIMLRAQYPDCDTIAVSASVGMISLRGQRNMRTSGQARMNDVHQIQPGRYAVLDPDGNPIPASLYTWGRFLQSGDNRIALSELKGHRISTIFLGLNHQYLPDAEPLWFETMIFSPERKTRILGKTMMLGKDLWCARCATRDQALAQHKEAEAWLTNYLNSK